MGLNTNDLIFDSLSGNPSNPPAGCLWFVNGEWRGSSTTATTESFITDVSFGTKNLSDLGTTAHTHTTGDITSGTFADARIAQSNVTQHQGSLSITESQISDLQSYSLTDYYVTGATLNGNTLEIKRNGLVDVTVDLSQFMDDTDTDNYVTGATMNGNTLELTRTGGSIVSVDLSQFLDDTNSNDYVSGATMNGTTLELKRTGGLGDVTVALSQFASSTHTHTLADVTDSGTLAGKNTIGTADIDDTAVSYTKIQNVSTTDRVLGRDTAGAGPVEEITPAALRTMINVADGATANDTDANLKNRANHTGTQLASTISDFDTEVSNNTDVTANTAKVTNATHTGEVTGSGVLTVDPTAITNKTLVTAVSGDTVLIADASDSNNLKKVDVNDFLSGGGGGGHTIKDEGSSLTQRTNLNFIGSGVVATDNAGTDSTDVTINLVTSTLATVQARRTTTYALTTGFVSLTMDATDEETDATNVKHNDTTTSRVDILAAGTYAITYHCSLNADTTQRTTSTRIYKNGTTLVPGSQIDLLNDEPNSADMPVVFSKTIIATLALNDYIELQAKDTNAGISLNAGAMITVTKLDGVKGADGVDGAQGPTGAGSNIIVQDEGVTQGTVIDTMDFVGAGVSVTEASGKATVTINNDSSNKGVVVRQSGNGTLSETWGNETFNTTVFENDTATLQHNDTNTERIDIKVTGNYKIEWSGEAECGGSTASNDVSVRIAKNGTAVTGTELKVSALANMIVSYHDSTILSLNANDYITFQARKGGSGTSQIREMKLIVTKF